MPAHNIFDDMAAAANGGGGQLARTRGSDGPGGTGTGTVVEDTDEFGNPIVKPGSDTAMPQAGGAGGDAAAIEAAFAGINSGLGECIPEVEEDTGPVEECRKKCSEMSKVKGEQCDILRKRVQALLKKRGCDSVVRAYKTSKRSCSKKKKSYRTKARSSCSRRGGCC